MAFCYTISFTHPDTRVRLRYYGAAESDWRECSSPRVHELLDWFGEEEFTVDRRREFKTFEEAESWARRLSTRAHLHLRSDWLNGKDFHRSVLAGDSVDRTGHRNPMHGRAHKETSRKAMAEAKKGRLWVYRGDQSKQVPPKALEALVKAGWKQGRPRKAGK